MKRTGVTMISRLILTFFTLSLLSACGSSAESNRHTGVYMLLDTSGTYANELDKARQIINFTLSRLQPGDSFAEAVVSQLAGQTPTAEAIANIVKAFQENPRLIFDQVLPSARTLEERARAMLPSVTVEATSVREGETASVRGLALQDLVSKIKKKAAQKKGKLHL